MQSSRDVVVFGPRRLTWPKVYTLWKTNIYQATSRHKLKDNEAKTFPLNSSFSTFPCNINQLRGGRGLEG